MGVVLPPGGLWVFGFCALAFLILVFIFKIDENSVLLREVRNRYDSEPKLWDRPAMIPAGPVGLVDAVSTPAVPPSPRARPDVPYVGADAELVLQRQRPHHDTLGSWAPSGARESDTICEEKPQRDADDCETKMLPRCGCGSIDVVPKGGLFACRHCLKVGALQVSAHQEAAQ